MKQPEKIIEAAREALNRNRPEEALALLDHDLLKNNSESIFLKGEICFKLQQWGDALNQFSAYLEHFPADKRAESYCQLIQNILGFYHKDLYNP